MRWGILGVVVCLSCAGTETTPGMQSLVRPESDPFFFRDVVVVLNAGADQGRDCVPGEVLPVTRDWSCNRQFDAGWQAQLRGLADALVDNVQTDSRTRLSIVVNTLGQQRVIGGREVLDGPRVATSDGQPIFRVPLDSDQTIAALRDAILRIELPLATHLPPARNQCQGWPQDSGRCTPGAFASWGMHAAAELLRVPEPPENQIRASQTRREVCLTQTRQDSFLLPNAGTNIVSFTPTFPAEAFSSSLAWTSAQDVVDRLSIISLQTPANPGRPDETAAVVQIDGEQQVDGLVNFEVQGSTSRGPFSVVGSVGMPAGASSDTGISGGPTTVSRSVSAASRLAQAIREAAVAFGAPIRIGYGQRWVSVSHATLSTTPLTVTVSGAGGFRYSVSSGVNTWADSVEDWGEVASLTAGSQRLIASAGELAAEANANAWQRAFAACLIPEFRLVGMEVTQSIQNWRQRVPLIRGKRTFVRA